MTSITLEQVFIAVYVLVDDWYRTEGAALLRTKVGAKPRFSNSELMTLMLVHDYVPYPGERQWVGFIRANYKYLFPGVMSVNTIAAAGHYRA